MLNDQKIKANGTREWRGAPGRDEDLVLKITPRRDRTSILDEKRLLSVVVEGSTTIDHGDGTTSRVEINDRQRAHAYVSDTGSIGEDLDGHIPTGSDEQSLAIRAYNGDETAAEELVGMIVGWAEEDFLYGV